MTTETAQQVVVVSIEHRVSALHAENRSMACNKIRAYNTPSWGMKLNESCAAQVLDPAPNQTPHHLEFP